MLHFLERIGIVQKENNRTFKMIPALIMVVLMLSFLGTTLYILLSSMA